MSTPKKGTGSPNYPKGKAAKWVAPTNTPKSQFKGVCYKKAPGKSPRWIAQICVNYKQIYLGSFPFTPEGEYYAAQAYKEAAKKYFNYDPESN